MGYNKILNVFEGFSGYGGGSFALKNISKKHKKFKYNVVGCSEIDKYADELYNANHKDINGKPIKNYGYINSINTKDVPDFDMFMGGFPCQPFSVTRKLKLIVNKKMKMKSKEGICLNVLPFLLE